ncbi:hypothetical protein PC128_g27097, partial [Phytophthora cactorum]
SGSVRERDDCQIATPIMDSVAKVAMQTRGSSARTQAHSVARSTAPPEHEVSVMDETISGHRSAHCFIFWYKRK